MVDSECYDKENLRSTYRADDECVHVYKLRQIKLKRCRFKQLLIKQCRIFKQRGFVKQVRFFKSGGRLADDRRQKAGYQQFRYVYH